MTITYSLAPIPLWYFADESGLPLAGGKMYTYSSLNPTERKAVYMDPAGANAYPNPVVFGANGQAGPFYWQFDTANPDDLYFLDIYDSDDNPIRTIDDYTPDGSGGGSIITNYQHLRNLVVNSVFWRNQGTIDVSSETDIVIAPGAHENLSSPDIRFIKSNTNAVDIVTFEEFLQGSTPLTGDVTPLYYLNYTCNNTPTGETQKCIQLPIQSKVKNLENTEVTLSFWAKANISGTFNIQLYCYQYYGSGGSPTASTPVTFGSSVTLTSSLAQYTVTATIPSTATATLGDCGDDALYFQIGLPLNTNCDIDIVKPSLYIGEVNPTNDIDLYDQVNAVISSPRTGDVRISLNDYEFGYVAMDDGTIGSSASNASNRANTDTFQLYKRIWEKVSVSYAPIYTSAGVVSTKGANASADFSADKQLSLTKTLGRVLAGTNGPTQISQTFTADTGTDALTVASTASFYAGVPVVVSTSGTLPAPLSASVVYYAIPLTTTTMQLATTPENAMAGTFIDITSVGAGTNTVKTPAYVLGQYLGELTHTMTLAELVAHNHTVASRNEAGAITGVLSSDASGATDLITNTSTTGSTTPFNVVQPTTFMNIFAKL